MKGLKLPVSFVMDGKFLCLTGRSSNSTNFFFVGEGDCFLVIVRVHVTDVASVTEMTSVKS